MSNTYTTKKALKIATALYMITDIMSEKEPLKWHLRGCAVSLLEAGERDLQSVIERTIDILSIARIARAVTSMNADVLEGELKSLLSIIEASLNNSKTEGAQLFEKTFFEIKEAVSLPEKTKEAEPVVIPKAEIKPEVKRPLLPDYEEEKVEKIIEEPKEVYTREPKIEEEVTVERPVTTLIPQGIRSAFSPRVTLIDADIEEMKERRVKQETQAKEKNNRRDTILNAIRLKDNCSIKDIASKLPSLSEKTIQRELVMMTEEGVLLKKGDRRWSTYSIPDRA